MRLQIKRWLAPPVFPNDDTKTRRALVLNTTLLTTLALALFLVAGNLAGGKVPLAVSGVDIVIFAVCLVLRRWTHQGRIGLAGGGLLAVGLAGVTLAIAIMGTTRVPAAGMYMLLVIAAGLLFDLGGLIVMTGLCALAMAGLIVAENAGWLPRPDYAVTFSQWITYTVLFAWAGSLTLFSLQSTRRALTRANQEIAERQRAESQREAALAALQQAHAGLEQRVAERTEELRQTNEELRTKIIERQQAEETIKSLAKFPDENPNPIARIGGDGMMLYANKAASWLVQSLGSAVGSPAPALWRDWAALAFASQVVQTIEVEYIGRIYAFNVAPIAEGGYANLYARDITDRKQAEAALRESEARYKNLFENNHAVMLVIDPDNAAIMDANPAAYAYYGWSREELLKKKIDEINTLTTAEVHAEMQLARAEKRNHFFFKHRRADGSIRDVEVYSGPLVIAGKALLYSIIHDITERKQAESQREAALEALKHSEAHYHLLADHMTDIIWLMDMNLKLTYISPSGEKTRGYTLAELQQLPLDQTLTPASFQAAMAVFAAEMPKVLTDPGYSPVFTLELEFYRRDGSLQSVESKVSIIRDEQGQPTSILGQDRDIAERKRAEEQIRRSETRLRSLVYILQYRAETTQEFLDNALQEAITLTESKIGFICFYYEDRQQFVLNTWSKDVMKECMIVNPPTIYELDKTGVWGEAVRQRRPILLNDYQADHPLKKGYPEGHARLTRFMAVPVFKDDHIVAVVSVANKASDYDEADVFQLTLLMDAVWKSVDIKRAEDALRELNITLEQRVTDRTAELRAVNEHLTELDRMKDEFMSRMSHELRTPLTSIKIYLELLETAKPEKREKYMQTLTRETDRLQALIEDVLTITDLSRDTLDLELDRADLNQVLEPRLAAWQAQAARRALAFHVDLAQPLPPARLDSLRTLQVVTQLINNAVSYTPSGSITLATRACADETGHWLTVSVADTGPGITLDDLPHIFERFYRGRAAADYKTPGTGVGLAISRQIAEKLGGRLTVETQVGIGSTFTLWLPRVPA
jgi:two-component system, OmpR family, phosphate regulon sensor histidine kinase PhoR